MGVEVKSGGEGVIVADRGCNDGTKSMTLKLTFRK